MAIELADVVDMHAHAFPDELAARAVSRLEAEGHVEAALDGTMADLLASMDASGVGVSVVASIATRPGQFEPILRWSASIASSRIYPFPSVHPDDPRVLERIDAIAAAGFRGIKLHPYYQEFVLDEERMIVLYRRIADRGLLLLCHTGFDIAYPRKPIADPPRIARVIDLVPQLALIAPHLGAWDDWDGVERLLVGKPLIFDVSFIGGRLDRERARRIVLEHPADRLVFGSDSPWADQAEAIAAVRELDLPPARLEALLWSNAARLLGLERDGRPYSSPLR